MLFEVVFNSINATDHLFHLGTIIVGILKGREDWVPVDNGPGIIIVHGLDIQTGYGINEPLPLFFADTGIYVKD